MKNQEQQKKKKKKNTIIINYSIICRYYLNSINLYMVHCKQNCYS